MALARIGVGANLGDAAATVRSAFGALERLGAVLRVSSLYRTKPWGVADQPDFINAAVLLETELSPRELLRELKTLETAFGRVPSARYGPRALDLDILSYDDAKIDEPDLIVPHPRLRERAFALVPLAEIDESYADAAEALPAAERAGVTRV